MYIFLFFICILLMILGIFHVLFTQEVMMFKIKICCSKTSWYSALLWTYLSLFFFFVHIVLLCLYKMWLNMLQADEKISVFPWKVIVLNHSGYWCSLLYIKNTWELFQQVTSAGHGGTHNLSTQEGWVKAQHGQFSRISKITKTKMRHEW